jgi:arylamine N-acetyltransferase
MTHRIAEIGFQVRLLAGKVFMERDVGKSAEKVVMAV